MFCRLFMVSSPVKHSDSHSHGSQRGSQLDLSAERQKEDKSLLNSSTPLSNEADKVNEVHQGLFSPLSYCWNVLGNSKAKLRDKLEWESVY